MVAGKREVLREFQDSHLMASSCRSLRIRAYLLMIILHSFQALVSQQHVLLRSNCFVKNSIHTSLSPIHSTGPKPFRT